MAAPVTGVDDIVTTTIDNRSGIIADNVSNNTALLYRLRERGNIKPFSGGATILEELNYQFSGSYSRYSGFDVLDTSHRQILTYAQYNIRQVAVAIQRSGLEELQNQSDEQIVELWGARIEAGEREMVDGLSTDLYSNGTASNGKQIDGLQSAVADAGTGTHGGINSTTNAFWQNQIYDFSDESVTASSTTIQPAMNTLYFNLCRNRDKPDLIVADNTYYRYYLESLQPQQRFTNARMADAGFTNLEFMGAPVVLDGGLSGDAPSAHMYMLNTDFIRLRPHSKRNMVPLNPDRYSTNQDAVVRFLAWAGNLTVNWRNGQGVILA